MFSITHPAIELSHLIFSNAAKTKKRYDKMKPLWPTRSLFFWKAQKDDNKNIVVRLRKSLKFKDKFSYGHNVLNKHNREKNNLEKKIETHKDLIIHCENIKHKLEEKIKCQLI